MYKSHSGSIVETLEDLKAKAESQMAEMRMAYFGQFYFGQFLLWPVLLCST